MVNQTPMSSSNEMPARKQAAAVPLSQFPVGTVAVVDALNMDAPDAALLRAMGLGCSCHLKLCRVGHPCIVAVLTEVTGYAGIDGAGISLTEQSMAQGTAQSSRSPAFACCASRIGLSHELAARVMVRPLV